jgi:hypothetical protein
MSRNAFSRFRARAADRAHVTYTPGTAWPVNGHPPGLSRAGDIGPVLMPSKQFRRFTSDPRDHGDCAPSSRSPPDASRAPFPHRSLRRSSANAACGGLKPPPAGRLRRARHLHLPHSTTDDSPPYIGSSSAPVTHDLVGLGADAVLAQDGAGGDVVGGQQVRRVLAAVAGAADRLAVDGDVRHRQRSRPAAVSARSQAHICSSAASASTARTARLIVLWLGGRYRPSRVLYRMPQRRSASCGIDAANCAHA